jgi:hypothetical protein
MTKLSIELEPQRGFVLSRISEERERVKEVGIRISELQSELQEAAERGERAILSLSRMVRHYLDGIEDLEDALGALMGIKEAEAGEKIDLEELRCHIDNLRHCGNCVHWIPFGAFCDAYTPDDDVPWEFKAHDHCHFSPPRWQPQTDYQYKARNGLINETGEK